MYGGVETFLTTLARCRHLAPSMDVSMALCFDDEVAARLRNEGVPTLILGDVRLRRPDSVWRARRTLAMALEDGGYDVVVCHQAWPHAIFGPVARNAGLPLVFWVHMAQTANHWLDRLSSRVPTDLVICNSRFTASTVSRQTAPVEVVYYPVALNRDDGLQRQAADELRAELRTPVDDVVIIQVSRMESLKGQRVCLAALANLKGRPGWTCWQVGGPQTPGERRYFDALRQDAIRLGVADRVRFAGRRSDVRALLRAADIFCQPNVEPEGFGISFIEAMSEGRPVVTSAIGAAPEVVDASCGVLTAANDPDALALALSSLADDSARRDQLGSRGRERAKMLCNPSEQMARIAAVLEDVVRVKRRAAARDRAFGRQAAL
jgi:glycosyltransferase involved in cell wall biosynthesis